MNVYFHFCREERAGKSSIIALVLVSIIILTSAYYLLRTSPLEDVFEYNQTAVDYLMTEYELSEEGAFILSLTEIQVEKISETQYQINAKFPTENYANITITLTPIELRPVQFDAINQSIYDYIFSYLEDDGEFSFQLEYSIPYNAIPGEMLNELSKSAKSSKNSPIFQSVSYPGIDPIVDVIEINAYDVAVKAVVKKFESGKVSDFEKAIGKSAGSKILEKGTLTKTYGATSSVFSSWKMKGQHEAWMNRLKALRDCAENPTNQNTKKAYVDDPAYKDRILNEIDSAINDIESNTAVRFLNALSAMVTKSSVFGKRAPWLGWVIAPVTAWNEKTLDLVSEETVKWVESMVVPCTGDEDEYEVDIVPLAWSGKRIITIHDSGGDGEFWSDYQEEHRETFTFTLTMDPWGDYVVNGYGEGLVVLKGDTDNEAVLCQGYEGETFYNFAVEGWYRTLDGAWAQTPEAGKLTLIFTAQNYTVPINITKVHPLTDEERFRGLTEKDLQEECKSGWTYLEMNWWQITELELKTGASVTINEMNEEYGFVHERMYYAIIFGT